jgi:hypothetical protein
MRAVKVTEYISYRTGSDPNNIHLLPGNDIYIDPKKVEYIGPYSANIPDSWRVRMSNTEFLWKGPMKDLFKLVGWKFP